MFRDRVKVKLRAGRGGDGRKSLGLNYLPTGGSGGKGGDVYILGDPHQYDLRSIKPEFLYSAQNGEMGGDKGQTGSTGADFVLKVPLTTTVYSSNGEVLARVTAPNEQQLVFKGGRGGLGNVHLRRFRDLDDPNVYRGQVGEEGIVELQLALQSDVILVGLPNAGKSSLLNTLTNAKAKVGSYAYTTTEPQLGRMDGMTLMDLPGLAPSSHKGTAQNLVRHMKSAWLIAHVVSLESTDPLADYQAIRAELMALDQELAAKTELIILSKSDSVTQEQVEIITSKFAKRRLQSIAVSILDDTSLLKLKQQIREIIPQSVQSAL